MKAIRVTSIAILLASSVRVSAQRPVVYDSVILGGRVMNPESGLDAVRNAGITGARVAIITARRIGGRDTIDARGLVVAPGVIDLHQHRQSAEGYRFQAQDGVTTALELGARSCWRSTIYHPLPDGAAVSLLLSARARRGGLRGDATAHAVPRRESLSQARVRREHLSPRARRSV